MCIGCLRSGVPDNCSPAVLHTQLYLLLKCLDALLYWSLEFQQPQCSLFLPPESPSAPMSCRIHACPCSRAAAQLARSLTMPVVRYFSFHPDTQTQRPVLRKVPDVFTLSTP